MFFSITGEFRKRGEGITGFRARGGRLRVEELGTKYMRFGMPRKISSTN